MPLNVVMFGPPGAGKGTQSERLAKTYGLPKISTGEILREAVHDRTPLGLAARETMGAGHLVSDDVMIGVVRERLERPDAAAGFVLDGFPRTVVQAEALERIVDGRGPLVVLNLVVPTEELVRRLAIRRVCDECGANASPDAPADARCARCGGPLVQRADDDEAVIRERLLVFQEQTQPVVDHYRGKPTFFSIDGNQPLEHVAAALRGALASVAPVAGAAVASRGLA